MATMQEPTSTPSDRFGPFGGRYVPETLIPALDELTTAALPRSGWRYWWIEAATNCRSDPILQATRSLYPAIRTSTCHGLTMAI